MREILLVVTLAMIGLLTFLTLSVLVRDGPDVLTVLSVIVLAMFGFGIVGALLNPPDR